MKFLNTLVRRLLNKELIFYFIFGILTTIVDISTFYILNTTLSINENISNIIAIFISTLFAFFTNKLFVFNFKSKNIKQFFLEFFKFILGRLFSMIIQIIGFWLLSSILKVDTLISKILSTAVAIIINFFISKFLVFKRD